MPQSYHALATISLPEALHSLHPPVLPEVAHINDFAHTIMVDFHYHTPPTIGAHQSLDDAKADMQLYHLPLLLVTDLHDAIVGIISSEDILGEKPVKLIQEKRIPRTEIEVAMVMTPASAMVAIEMDELQHARVGHIIQTLRSTKQHTLVVIQKETPEDHIVLRGLFSASLISRQLDKDITLLLSEAQSIAELQHDLHQ